MARPSSRNGFYRTIEYIGPRPQKPKRRHFFGGWVIGVIALGMAFWFGRPLVPFLKAAQEGVSPEQAEMLIGSLRNSKSAGDRLAAAALTYARGSVTYDPCYYKIAYPMGDVAATKGAAVDVIIRCFRQVGIDLQKDVHLDMLAHFKRYPQLWGSLVPDTNIDHRRVANLQRFFERNATVITPTHDPVDYQPGDVVVWEMANSEFHIGIVVPGPGERSHEPWVVHHPSTTPKWENVLLDYKIIGHFRYPGDAKKS